jgi:hypothetical protein
VIGYAGARNCKYLEKVTVTRKACAHCDNWKQYSVHSPDTPLEKLLTFDANAEELEKDLPVMEMPVQSLITVPSAGDVLAAAAEEGREVVHVKGIAWGGGGDGVNRVDVSLDGGKNFTRAELHEKPIKERRGSKWSWVFFEKDIPIPEEIRQKLKAGEKIDLELTSKAVNTSLNVQPERPEPYRNAHGCCVNHWYRVPISVDPNVYEDKKAPDGEFGNKPSGGVFRTPFRNFDELPLHVQAERGINMCPANAAVLQAQNGCPYSQHSHAANLTTVDVTSSAVATLSCPVSKEHVQGPKGEHSPVPKAVEEECCPVEVPPAHIPAQFQHHPMPSTRPSLVLK